jgi:hypothetical protein
LPVSGFDLRNDARTDDPGDAGRPAQHILAQMEEVSCDVHGQGDTEGDHCRYHDDYAQFALDGEIREPTNQ